MPSSRWSTPSTGRSIEPTTSAACRSVPTLLRMTPTISTEGSNPTIPRTTAPIDRDACETSTTSTTGDRVTVAT